MPVAILNQNEDTYHNEKTNLDLGLFINMYFFQIFDEAES